MRQASLPSAASTRPFDHMAESYDSTFTESLIGRAQRTAVWEAAQQIFAPGLRMLELNCGTGEDALHFARNGFDVTACDISPTMVAKASQKAAAAGMLQRVSFQVRAIEEIAHVRHRRSFECAFSNFSGLNCVEDLSGTAKQLAPLLSPGAPVLFCLSTRFCVWEIVWHLLHGDPARAFRRCSGRHQTRLGGVPLSVFYPTLRHLRRSFAPDFNLVSFRGVGITVPPSYVESWMRRHPRLMRIFQSIDTRIRTLPGLRVLGDHMLIQLERVSA